MKASTILGNSNDSQKEPDICIYMYILPKLFIAYKGYFFGVTVTLYVFKISEVSKCKKPIN